MFRDPCLCGATDCPRCYPLSWNQPEPTDRHFELALESVIECVLEHGQYPATGRARFDLYDYLLEHSDQSYAYELLVASLNSDTRSFEARIERGIKTIEEMLTKHLQDSDLVNDLAIQIANDK
jgi:hypothetical protein